MTKNKDDFKHEGEEPRLGKELKDYVLTSLHEEIEETEEDKHITEEDKPVEEPVRRSRSASHKTEELYTERKKENNMVKKIVLIITLALFISVGIAGYSFYRYFTSSLNPLDPKNEALVQIEIPIGSSSKDIGQILEKNHIIKSGLIFSYFVKMNNLSDFQAGYYQMAPNMTLEAIADNLQEGGSDEPESLADAKLTIPEGYSIDQIAELFDQKTDVTKDEFLTLMNDDAFFNEMVTAYPQLLSSSKESENKRYLFEGYLYPATYNYYKDMPLKDIVTQMIDKTNQVMTPYYDQIAQGELSVQQVMTLASLVEKEGVTPEDRKKIAQVFLNRLAIDMPLQSDISILYAMDEHKVHLSNKDTQIESPYNLYVNKGTGPGPFNNPSEEAISAVLNPEPNDYIYFLADVDTGKVYYAVTYEEHLALKEQYIDSKTK